MSKLQESLMSNPDVYAGGAGMIPMPEFDPADEFIPDAASAGLVDGDDVPEVLAPTEVVELEEVEELPAEVVPVEPVPVEPVPIVEVPEVATVPAITEAPVRNKQDFLHRLNAKNAKLAANAARIADLEARLAGTPAPAPVAPRPAAAPAIDLGIPDLAARRQRVLDLTIDGNTSEAAALQSEIDSDVIAATVAATTKQVLENVNTARAEATFEDALADIAVAYPELDETGDAYDTKTARMINAVMAEYIDDDYSRPDALRAATEEVMRLKYPAYFATALAVAPVAPARSTAPVKAQVAKAVAAAAAQPSLPVGSTSARTVATAPMDIFSMSDEEFAKLTPAQLSELRGDTL